MNIHLNSDAGMAVAVLAVAAAMIFGPWLISRSEAEVAVSCNNLKAAALAASQPVPECSKK
jgi:hypothetical protein